MKNVQERFFLQRRGVGSSFQARVGNIHFDLYEWQASGLYRGEAVQRIPAKDAKSLDRYTTIYTTDRPAPLREILSTIERRFSILFDERIEAYMYNGPSSHAIWPHVKTDVYRTCAVYEKYSDTIRHARTNVCLVAWVDGKEVLDVDAAATPYRALCAKALEHYHEPVNQRNSPEENKAWLAWLIGEYIKDELHEEPEILVDMIR